MNVCINFLAIRCDYVVKITAKKGVEAKACRTLKTHLDKDTVGSNISESWKQRELLIRRVLSLSMVPLSIQVHN